MTPQDRAATHAYLVADYAYAQALVANSAASRASVEALASALRSECAGVLAGLPRAGESGPLSSARSFAREAAEQKRRDEQLGDLEEELSSAGVFALAAPNRGAEASLLTTIKPLRWSDPAVNREMAERVATLEEGLSHAAPNVCADMKAWAASGYKTLSPASAALAQEHEAGHARAIAGTSRRVRIPQARGRPPDPLAPYEDPEDKALATKIGMLEGEWVAGLRALAPILDSLRSALGINRHHEESPEASERPRAGAVKIGHGRTAVGGRYGVWVERVPAGAASGSAPCPRTVVPVEASAGRHASDVHGTTIGMCLAHKHREVFHLNCNGGLLTIEALTLARARRVRLNLSNGRHVTSRVAVVPARLGGPAGFYYQVIRGPTPIPVSLTELDARGKTLTTVKLFRVVECTKDPLRFLPGGLGPIVRGRVPHGPRFSIVGEHYRFLGRDYFEMDIETELGGGGESPGGPPRLLSWHRWTACHPHEYAIVYGLLKVPRDSVLVRGSGGLRKLRRVRIPKRFHAGGVLVYVVLPRMPTELLVRAPGGKTVFTEGLGRLAREAKETCEGEAEGSA